jgi:hypothetical protein
VLRFHKKGRDGSGKADAFFTDSDTDRVWGVVYAMTSDEKIRLDRFEGLGRDYIENPIEVRVPGGAVHQAWIYRAGADYVDPTRRPFSWYLRLCVVGARQHGLPSDYVDQIEGVSAVDDPDRERCARELAVIATSR